VIPCVSDQAIVLNAQLMPATFGFGYSLCRKADTVYPNDAPVTYTLSNFILTKVYTQLSPASVNSILKSTFRHQIKSYINTVSPL
jgi:hypothetical protein